MKTRFTLLLTLVLLVSFMLPGQAKVYTDALKLTLGGKIFQTEKPYERTNPLEGMSQSEKGQAQNCSGLTVAFETNSSSIGVSVIWSGKSGGGTNMGAIAARGFDLYIQQDGQWVWAGNACPKKDAPGEEYEVTLIPDSGKEAKQCLVYLPLYGRIESLNIVTDDGAWIKAGPQPFRKRIAVFGSSFTQGSGASRCAMTWEAQLSRATGLNFMNFGFSGNSKLQPYFAQALAQAEVDAYVFDAFSNPTPEEIEERLEPFIQTIRKKQPRRPMIFLQTIYRERCNFNPKWQEKEKRKRETADRLMRQMVAKYPNVYWVTTTNATSPTHETSTDGTHPDAYGYSLWMESVKEPILNILNDEAKARETADTVRILGVGNSWTRDSMRQLWAIAHSAGRPVIVGHAYLGGSRLMDQFFGLTDTSYYYTHGGKKQRVHDTYQYWKYKDGPDAVKEPDKGYKNGLAGIGVTLERAVSDEKWDWIVFQPEATFGGDYPLHLGQGDNGYDLRKLMDAVCALLPEGASPRIALMVPFAYPQGNTDYRSALVHFCNDDIQPANQREWDKLYKKQYKMIQSAAAPVAKHIGADTLINVGAAIEAARADRQLSRAGYKLQRSQGNTHLAEGLPMYIASLCYAYILLGLTPDNIPFYPTNGYAVSGDRGETTVSDFVLTAPLTNKARHLTWKALQTPPTR